MLREDLGEFIARKRAEHLLSQEQLALKAGLSMGTIWSLEQGGTRHHYGTLRKIADALNIAYTDLLEKEVAS